MNELHLFAGAGGGIYGGLLLGHHPVCAVELDPYCRQVLLQRQRDGVFPWFPVWDDVSTFDGTPYRGSVDIVAGGFPCQGISSAGKQEGLSDPRSGLWFEMARVIREVRPRYAFVENSPMLTSLGLGQVLGDLAEMGFDARWGVLGAHHVGAPHHRERIWILAHASEGRLETNRTADSLQIPLSNDFRSLWREGEPRIPRVSDGVAHWKHRIAATGNGQVPAVVAVAFRTLYSRLIG